MIKCIIVEDEALAQDVIKSHLKKIDKCELVAVCNNAPEAKAVLETNDIDVMFLDIQLPGMTGLHFLSSLSSPPLVVLTTAYAEYALESYEFNIVDYLLKPVSFERFSKAMDKIIEGKLYLRSAKEKSFAADHIFIKSNGKFFKVNLSEIILIEGMKDYLKIHTKDNKLITLQTMNEMEKILPPQKFIRVHKSFIVALSHIKSIYGNNIEMNNATVPIGGSYKDNVMQLLKK